MLESCTFFFFTPLCHDSRSIIQFLLHSPSVFHLFIPPTTFCGIISVQEVTFKRLGAIKQSSLFELYL
ncbi:hypothetical protein DNTS_008382 [Danionella cerebrum]|uniref:Uncharacterized protein n=1 Tax=Danionella cerebrum TaxID=2873325 RepID=A0A553N0X9_9TELE|nr:hypothetical protein DNTS_008382 [Danionella translucida]